MAAATLDLVDNYGEARRIYPLFRPVNLAAAATGSMIAI